MESSIHKPKQATQVGNWENWENWERFQKGETRRPAPSLLGFNPDPGPVLGGGGSGSGSSALRQTRERVARAEAPPTAETASGVGEGMAEED